MNGILHERDFRGCERKTEITEITTDKSITVSTGFHVITAAYHKPT